MPDSEWLLYLGLISEVLDAVLRVGLYFTYAGLVYIGLLVLLLTFRPAKKE